MEHAKRFFPFLVVLGFGVLLGKGLPSFSPSLAPQGAFLGAISETAKDMMGGGNLQPAYEVDVKDSSGMNRDASSTPLTVSTHEKEPKASLQVVLEKKSEIVVAQNSSSLSQGASSTSASSPSLPLPLCAPGALESSRHTILFNEIAWMGNSESAQNEWVELRNNSGEDISLTRWQIINASGTFKIIFGAKDRILLGGFFLLERTDDDTVKSVKADALYSGSFPNEGDRFFLFDAECRLIDEIDASHGWPGGANDTKHTLERNIKTFDWHTSNLPGGTPRAQNSEEQIVSAPSPVISPPPYSYSESYYSPTVSASSSASPIPPSAAHVATVLVSEIFVGSDGNADDEFIELYNAGTQSVDLTGWSLKKKSSAGSESTLLATSRLTGKSILPQKYFLLTHEGGYAGSIGGDASWPSSYSLAYKNNAVVLYDASGVKREEVSWDEITAGKSYARASWDSSAFGLSDPSPRSLAQ